MSISIQTSAAVQQTRSVDHDNDRLRNDHDGDDAVKSSPTPAQSYQQRVQLEKSVQPNLGQNLNVTA